MHSVIRGLGILFTAMVLSLAATSTARAQDPNSGEQSSGGGAKPIYGYIGTGVVGAMIAFAVCKSARR